jgi:shikimate dehydrogenase
MIKASVIGWPIAHSRSPLIHGYWLKVHGIDGVYTKEPVEPGHLDAFFATLRNGNHVGTNVTLPHKEAAVAHVDRPDDRVHRIGALNTVWREHGKLHATSTDGPGFFASVHQRHAHAQVKGAVVTILGAGGSARAIVDEALRIGVDRVFVCNRTPSRAQALSDHFGAKVRAGTAERLPSALRDTSLMVNTTSAGLKGETGPDMPWDKLNSRAVVADIVYTPLITPFLLEAKARGHAIVPGLGMLLHQAVDGFEKWFGVRPEVTQELHDLVARDIDPEYQP